MSTTNTTMLLSKAHHMRPQLVRALTDVELFNRGIPVGLDDAVGWVVELMRAGVCAGEPGAVMLRVQVLPSGVPVVALFSDGSVRFYGNLVGEKVHTRTWHVAAVARTSTVMLLCAAWSGAALDFPLVERTCNEERSSPVERGVAA